MTMAYTTTASPVGELTLVASTTALVAVLWEDDAPGRVRLDALVEDRDHPILVDTAHQLTAYFAGELRVFDVPIDFRGTAFQRRVWQALLTIPFGETRSYADIARQVGRPTAWRAVGAANGRNPVSIIAPCHRVVGSDGSLTGFAGGLAAKELLLSIERGQGASPAAPASR